MLFIERLEQTNFRHIMGPECLDALTWMRYVDDVLVIAPDDVNLDVKLQDLNTVDSKIQFILEKEINGKLPFLDTMIMRSGHTAKFKVYRKPSNK